MKHLGRKLLLPAAAIALAGGSFAFLASNNVGTSFAGSGNGTIAGYNVGTVHYTTQPGYNTSFSGNNQTDYITAVTFTLDNPASPSNVRAVVSEPNLAHDFDYGVCTPASTADLTFTCTINGGVNDANHLAETTDSTILTVLAAS